MGEREALIERDEELAAIDELLGRAAAGAGGTLVIEGPAGIGKTSLLVAAKESARRLSFATALARGGELERELPFVVPRDLFRPLLADTDDAEQTDLLAGTARFAVSITDPSGATSTPEPAVALEALAQLAANLAERAPLLLVIDDLHWVDPSSLQFAAYMGSRLEGTRLALLVGTRPAGEETHGRTLDSIRRERNSQVMRPTALSEAATGAIVERFIPNPAHEFVAACHRASGGNPLYLEALTQAAGEIGLAGRADEAGVIAGLGPEAVSVSVRGRLASLSQSARELARAVAIMGLDAELRHAAALARIDPDVAAEAAAELVDAELLTPGEPLEFVHPVVRTTVYELRPEIARAADHARAARLLHDSAASAYRIGPHLLAAARSGEPWVIEDLREAAREALRRAAPDQAVPFLERALAVYPSRTGRADLLRELAAAEWRAGREGAIGHMRGAIEEDARPGDEYLLVGWLLAAHRLGEALGILDELIAGADSERDQLRPLAHYVAIAQNAGAEDLAERSQRLRVLVEALGDDDGPATTVVGWLDVVGGNPAGADRLERVIDRALSTGSRVQQIELWIYAAWGLLAAERFESLQRLVDRAVVEARSRASATMTAMAFSTRAQLAYRTGRLGEAEDSARTSLEAVSRGGPRIFASGARTVLLECAAEAGDRAEELPEESEVNNTEIGADDFIAAHERFALGRLRIARGEIAAGKELLTDCGRRMTNALVTTPGYAPWRSELALALARDGESACAATLAAEELRLARAAGTPRAYGIALRAVGLIAGGDDGIRILREAVDVLGGSGAPLEHARALIDLGSAMRRRKMQLEARDPLRDGLDIAHRSGARVLARRATEELGAAGGRPRSAARWGAEALTASERRVARLAAEGRTNREIAEELFVTVKTVEKHLAASYRKLDISARGELPAAMESGG